MTRDDFIHLRVGQRVHLPRYHIVGTIAEIVTPTDGPRIIAVGNIEGWCHVKGGDDTVSMVYVADGGRFYVPVTEVELIEVSA